MGACNGLEPSTGHALLSWDWVGKGHPEKGVLWAEWGWVGWRSDVDGGWGRGGGQGKVRGRDRAWGTTYSAKPGAWNPHVHWQPAPLLDGAQAKRAAPLQPVAASASATHLQTRHAN